MTVEDSYQDSGSNPSKTVYLTLERFFHRLFHKSQEILKNVIA